MPRKLTNRAKIIKLREAVETYQHAHHMWNVIDKSEASSEVNRVLAETATTRHALIKLCEELVKE